MGKEVQSFLTVLTLTPRVFQRLHHQRPTPRRAEGGPRVWISISVRKLSFHHLYVNYVCQDSQDQELVMMILQLSHGAHIPRRLYPSMLLRQGKYFVAKT